MEARRAGGNEGYKMKIYPTTQKVIIKWFGVSQDVRVPASASMRGTWGWDATCSCGWDSKTGGAIRTYVQQEVRLHKIMEHDYTRLAAA
jgi:4-hydroxy-3-methylbut-2-enyl diphosphate reductase IspH